MTIEEGAYTRQVTVTLALSATDGMPSSGVVQMRVHQVGEAWGDWKPYGNSETLRSVSYTHLTLPTIYSV